MTDDLRARIAEAIGQHCPDHYEHHWEAAADAILAFIQPELAERDARIRYWQDSRESYAQESRKLIAQRNELRAGLSRIRAWAGATDHGAAAAEILQLLDQLKGNR